MTPQRAYRHKLIEEFRSVLNLQRRWSNFTDGIVVLDYFEDRHGTDFKTLVLNPENLSRIDCAVRIYYAIALEKYAKQKKDLTTKDLESTPLLPTFFLNALRDALPILKEYTQRQGIPEKQIAFMDNGKLNQGNTKTQCEIVCSNPNLRHVVLVSQSYHVPRLKRTVAAVFPEDMGYKIIGVPLSDMPYNVYRKVRGEIKRIIAYSAKGDIAR